MKTAHYLAIAGCALVGGALIFGGRLSPSIADETPPRADAAVRASAEAEASRHFTANIAPLLTRHCLECHGSRQKKGRLDLSRKDAAMAGGESGPVIVPGKADDSLLWHYVDSGEMPPKSRPPLAAEEKRLLRQWIDAGAVWAAEAIGAPTFADERFVPHREFEYDDDARDPGPILLRRLTVMEYIDTVRAAVGVDIEKEARRMLPPDLRADGFTNTAYNLNVDLGNIEAYARLAQIIVGRMDVAAFAAEYAKSEQLADANMREAVAGMGKWLLRGPLAEHEIEAFLRIATAVAREEGDFHEAVGYVLEAMLQSPRFIYLMENHRGDGSVRRVGNYELASRLSYILWGGPPDKELLRAAGAGELSDRGKVEAQVRRMLDDPRAVERSAQFVDQWLNLDQLSNLRPNADRFPTWNAHLAADMRAETLAFFKYVAWEKRRPLSELMNAQVTFATPRLAAHYGLDGSLGAHGGDEPSAPSASAKEERQAAETPSTGRVAGGLLALYAFQEGSGDQVQDLSGTGEPLHLKIADMSAITWNRPPQGTPGGGLVVHRPTVIATAGPAKRLVDAVKGSGAVTLEAWVTPANAAQSGPARIMTLSSGSTDRNFTLGQDGDKYDVRFRTTKSNNNGQPSLAGPSRSAAARPTHVVFTRDASGKATLFLNGDAAATRDMGGELRNWQEGFCFAVANELTGDRPWQGTLHLAAVYGRALSADEVRQNHAAGAALAQSSVKPAAARLSPPAERGGKGGRGNPSYGRAAADLQALWQFDEGEGETIRDVAEAGEPLNLKIENMAAVRWRGEQGASRPGGLSVEGPTLIAAAGSTRRLIDAVKRSNAVTLEAWITPANAAQSGPARILTLSSGISQRNFTLGQEVDKFDVRFRTTSRDINGLPSMSSSAGSAKTEPTHVVFTRGATGTGAIYVNGQEQAGRDVAGNLSNWADGFDLALANETSKDRPWQGTLHLAAIYSRALTPDEVRLNYTAGPRPRQELVRYDLSSVPARGGLLTQGSTLTAGGDEASMVARGLFVLHDILSSGVEDPPPDVDTTPVATKAGLTQRAIAEGRLADSSCSGCHARFEPLAFGLEKFDGVGAFHEVDEHGNRLRDDGEILFPGRDKPVPYKSSAELMDLLAESERVGQSITLKVTQFALGRPLVKTDAAMLAEIHKSAQENGGTYAALITAIVMSDLVQTTRTEGGP